MDISSDDLYIMVFRRVISDDLGEFSLNSQMLSVLVELNGRKSIGEIGSRVGLNMGTMREVISGLIQLKLIEPIEGAIHMLDRDFFAYLNAQLSLAIGPLAEVLIEDAVSDLGHNPSKFPIHRAAELVDMLAHQIRREEKRIIFQRAMLEKIKEKYPE